MWGLADRSSCHNVNGGLDIGSHLLEFEWKVSKYFTGQDVEGNSILPNFKLFKSSIFVRGKPEKGLRVGEMPLSETFEALQLKVLLKMPVPFEMMMEILYTMKLPYGQNGISSNTNFK